jgi:hypothetical protein
MDIVLIATPDLRAILLFVVAVSIPAVFLIVGKKEPLLVWLGFTLSVQVFDSQFFTNLPASRVIGLLCGPGLLAYGIALYRTAPGRLWLFNFAYLVLLAILFGWIWPWPDTTGTRPFTLQAGGRSIVYLAKCITDVSLTVFVASMLREPRRVWLLMKGFLVGAVATACAGLWQAATGYDLYFAITRLNEYVMVNTSRPRGLSFEPRSLGMACVYGIVLTLIGRRQLGKAWGVALAACCGGLVVSGSFSAMGLFGAGLAGVFLASRGTERRVVVGLIIGVALMGFVVAAAVPSLFREAAARIQFYGDLEHRYSGPSPLSSGEAVAYRLDVFDASALLFFLKNPHMAWIGTGPGLVSLPASSYVPPGVYSEIWSADVGINSLPFHGLLLEVSNSGVVGLLTWCLSVALCLRALGRCCLYAADESELRAWSAARAVFLTGSLLYVVQVSVLPIWSVVLGVGWSAAGLAGKKRRAAVVKEAQ